MNAEKKNLQESVYTKLKNLALAKKRPTQEVLRYYAMERFLYRLSISSHKNSFFLKGGLMLMVWDPTTHRPTVDIDLLARTNNSIENISEILKVICFQLAPDDGIKFDSTDLKVSESQIETEYSGLSARFSAQLHTAKLPLQLDIGFSDKIYPNSVELNYPTLLNFPAPKLKGYTPETLIAEKLEAMIKLGAANTRMKDFYDVWVLLNQFQIKSEVIAPIIRNVFSNRNTFIPESPNAFSEAFYNSFQTKGRWDSFLKSISQDHIPLEKVILEIKKFFLPLLNSK